MLREVAMSTIARRGGQAIGLTCLAALFLAAPVGAQGPDRDERTFTCASMDGQRTSCEGGRSRGDVVLKKQLGDVRCVEVYIGGHENGSFGGAGGSIPNFFFSPDETPPLARVPKI